MCGFSGRNRLKTSKGTPSEVTDVPTNSVATVGDARLFCNGRSLAAWIGLTPKQHSSGGKELLLGISRRGDGYLRRQLMHGARSLVKIAQGREGKLWAWINGLLARRSFNTTVAAVANRTPCRHNRGGFLRPQRFQP